MMVNKNFIAVILAGGRETGELNKFIKDSDLKPLIDIRGKTVLEMVLDSVVEVEEFSLILITGPPELKEHVDFNMDNRIRFVENRGSVVDGMKSAYDYSEDGAEPIFFTSDIPLITTMNIKSFIERINHSEADAIYLFVPKNSFEREFKEPGRTFFKLKEGEFSGGDMGYVSKFAFQQAIPVLENLHERRKNTGMLVKLLGLKYSIKFVIKKLSIIEIEARIKKILGINVKFMIFDDPRVAMDIDKTKHLSSVIDYIERNKING